MKCKRASYFNSVRVYSSPRVQTTTTTKKTDAHKPVEICVLGICLNLMKSNAQAFMLMEICELNKFNAMRFMKTTHRLKIFQFFLPPIPRDANEFSNKLNEMLCRFIRIKLQIVLDSRSVCKVVRNWCACACTVDVCSTIWIFFEAVTLCTFIACC